MALEYEIRLQKQPSEMYYRSTTEVMYPSLVLLLCYFCITFAGAVFEALFHTQAPS